MTYVPAVGWSGGTFADDFHHEIYPQAEVMLDGRNPYPTSDWDPTAAPNFIWPTRRYVLAAHTCCRPTPPTL